MKVQDVCLKSRCLMACDRIMNMASSSSGIIVTEVILDGLRKASCFSQTENVTLKLVGVPFVNCLRLC